MLVSASRSARCMKLFWAQKWVVPLPRLRRGKVEWSAVVDMSTRRAIAVGLIRNRTLVTESRSSAIKTAIRN